MTENFIFSKARCCSTWKFVLKKSKKIFKVLFCKKVQNIYIFIKPESLQFQNYEIRNDFLSSITLHFGTSEISSLIFVFKICYKIPKRVQ